MAERSFKTEVQQLRLAEGAILEGEGVLAQRSGFLGGGAVRETQTRSDGRGGLVKTSRI